MCETSILAGENGSNAGMVLEPAVGAVTSWFSRQLEPEPVSIKTQLLLFPQLLSNCTLYYC